MKVAKHRAECGVDDAEVFAGNVWPGSENLLDVLETGTEVARSCGPRAGIMGVGAPARWQTLGAGAVTFKEIVDGSVHREKSLPVRAR